MVLPAAEIRPTVGLLADIQQSISFVTGPGSQTSQEADTNTQPGQTLYISLLFFHSCANKCERNSQEI